MVNDLMFEGILYQIDREERCYHLLPVNSIVLVNLLFDSQRKKRTDLHLVDLDQVEREIDLLAGSYQALVALVKNIVEYIGHFVEGVVGLKRMALALLQFKPQFV